MANKLNISVPISKYEVNGQEKTRWFNIWTLVQKDDGGYFISFHDAVSNVLKLILWFSWNWMASVFEQGERNNTQTSKQEDDVDSDLPF
jgi:hypothetical protein